MATTISLPQVTAGNKVLASDLNTPLTTVQNFLNSIDGENIQTNTIPGDRIKANSIAGTKLLDASVTVGKIGNAAVTTVKLGGNVVTAAKIGTSAVTTVKIADAAVSAAKLGIGITRIKHGKYTGTGITGLAVTGVGWTPDEVRIQKHNGDFAWTTVTMQADAAGRTQNVSTGASVASGILSLDVDGFTLGAAGSVNSAATTHYYVALKTT